MTDLTSTTPEVTRPGTVDADMAQARFTVRFHSWFRVGSLLPRDGLDLAVDHEEPLPPDHLRGLMRAQARTLVSLGHLDPALVDTVFGTTRQPGAWTWLPVEADGGWRFATRSRVSIDPTTHTAQKDFLLRAEVAAAHTARFTISQVERLDPDASERHRALLRVTGCGVHHLGSHRRRGLGLVTVTTDPPLTGTDLDLIRPTPAPPSGDDPSPSVDAPSRGVSS